MLKAKIKISQVTNLTDARYFAAWGVDYLGFDINPASPFFISPPLVKEIADWIEGPKIILECHQGVDDIWIQNYIGSIGEVCLEHPLSQAHHLRTFTIGNQVVAIYSSDKAWSSLPLPSIENLVKTYDEVLLDIPFSVQDIDRMLDFGIKGFVLRGGEEEKVGFKSYDDLDEIFDHLIE
jgi:phosphoribosylanthranilate isomerase